MNTVKIFIDGSEKEASTGLLQSKELYALSGCSEEVKLYLNRDGDIDIPLQQEEYIIIHGGESFVTGKSNIENNPLLRKPLTPKFNSDPLSSENALRVAKITGKELKALDKKFPNGRIFADIGTGVDSEIEDEYTLIVQEQDSYFVIPPNAYGDKAVDAEECAKNSRKPPRGNYEYKIKIDGEKYSVGKMVLTGAAILALVGKSPNDWRLNQKFQGGKRERVDENEDVEISKPGVERFETVHIQGQQGNYL